MLRVDNPALAMIEQLERPLLSFFGIFAILAVFVAWIMTLVVMYFMIGKATKDAFRILPGGKRLSEVH